MKNLRLLPLFVALMLVSGMLLGTDMALAASSSVAAAPAAVPEDVRIVGRVKDAVSGEGLPGALVTAREGKKPVAQVRADSTGRYEFRVQSAAMKKGTVEVRSLGFAAVEVPLSQLAEQSDVVLVRDDAELDEYTVVAKSSMKIRHPGWVANAVIYEANVRQATAGRNFEDLMMRLPALREMGVNVIQLTPIHPISQTNRVGTLGRYDASSDFRGVNPEFGTVDDLLKLVKVAHILGLKVVLEEALGYSGADHAWVEQQRQYYVTDTLGAPVLQPGRTDVYRFDHTNPDWRKEIIDALTYWVKEVNIDGFCFMGADELPLDFWLRARRAAQRVKPIVFIAEASNPELFNEAFDLDYGLSVTDAMTALAAHQGENRYAIEHNIPVPQTNARDIEARIKEQINNFPKRAHHVNMTGNHLINATEGNDSERYGAAARAMAVLAYSLPGVPMLHTGQEVGWEQSMRLTEHDTVPDYEFNPPMQEFYKKLNSLRANHPALWQRGSKSGSFKVLPTTSDSILVFERKRDDDRIIIVANLSSSVQHLEFVGKTPNLFKMRDHFFRHIKDFPTELEPWECRVYRPLLKVRIPPPYIAPRPRTLGELQAGYIGFAAAGRLESEINKARKEGMEREWADE